MNAIGLHHIAIRPGAATELPRAAADVADHSFQMERLWLRFRDPDVEEVFTRTTFLESLIFIRAYLLAGTGLFICFGLLDLIAGGTATHYILAIRYGVVCPILIGIFCLTYWKDFYRIGQAALSTAMLSSGLGVVAMTAIMPPPHNSDYYAGIIMVVIYCGSLIRLKYRYSVLISVFLVLSYQLSAIWLNPISRALLISNDFFLVMANVVGLFSTYIQELYIRRTYASRRIIEQKNEVTSILLREANKASKAKSDFLANMSHELRTPLNAIIGFSDVIRQEIKGPLGNAAYLEYINEIHASGIGLLEKVNDVLDLTRAESGAVEIRDQVFDLGEILGNCVERISREARRSEIGISVSGADNLKITLDEKLFVQVMDNLLSNAVKFSHPGGRVEITVRHQPGERLAIDVADQGIGIDAADIERVMRPFEQVESTYARKNGGTGLGLPLAAKLIELLGGKLTVSSVLGRGTVVTLTLPLSRLVTKA